MFRLASYHSETSFLEQQGFDSSQTEEIIALLRSRGVRDTLEDLLDEPFRSKSKRLEKVRKSRFSDGSFPVFYGSLEGGTAEEEARHWFPKYVAQSRNGRTGYYQRFRCEFGGAAKDLRPMSEKWPDLTHDTDYEFCNQLGGEAVEKGLDGLLVQSVRREGGTNLPTFERGAVKNPVAEALVAITYNPETGEVSLSRG